MPTDPAFWKNRVTIETDVITLLATYGNLCLALRHPENKGQSRALIMQLVKEIGEELVLLGAMTQEQTRGADQSRPIKEQIEARTHDV